MDELKLWFLVKKTKQKEEIPSILDFYFSMSEFAPSEGQFLILI